MFKRALNAGILAGYSLADAWFHSKGMIRLNQATSLVAVLRMQKNKMKYRISEFVHGQTVTQELDVQAFYKHCARKTWQPVPGQRYQAKALDVELNMAENQESDEWIKV